MRTSVDQRFEKGDPVREYWLAHGDGFAVETRRGRVVGHVLESVLDPHEGRIVSLVVRWTLLGAVPSGTSELPADKVQAAVPARGTFVLDGAAEQAAGERARPRVSLDRARPALDAVARGSRTGGSALSRGAAVAAARVGPVARRGNTVLQEWVVAAALWLAGVVRWTVAAVQGLVRRGLAEVRARAQAGRGPE